MRHLFLLLLITLTMAIPASAQTITKLIVVSPLGEPIGGGSSYVLTSGDGFVFNATSNPENGVTVTLHNADYSTWWQIDFAAVNNNPLAATTYADCIRYPQPFDTSRNQLQASSSNAPSCTSLTGTFTIKQLTWTSPISVGTFWVTLEQSCQGDPPLYLELMYNMDAPTAAPRRSWGELKSRYR